MSGTLTISLDGYTDLPPGKIANVVTFVEMTAPPAAAPLPAGLAVVRVEHPTAAWYRGLYTRIGQRWLWFSRAVMSDTALSALLASPAAELHVLRRNGEDIGMAELDRSEPGTVEIVSFGVVPEAVGTGAARALMETVLAQVFAGGAKRVWLHTCSFDHPAAVPFYLKRGFRAFKFAIEVSDDPRRTGHLPKTAAPQIPLIE